MPTLAQQHRLQRALGLLASALLLSACASAPKGSTAGVDAEPKVYSLYDVTRSADIPNGRASDDLETVRDAANPDTFLMQVTLPSMTAYLPDPANATGTAVVICPGGGYRGVSIVKEGYEIARRLNREGIAAFVLKYRDPLDATMTDKKFGPLQDVQQAIALVRENADAWNVDTDKVGVMGFSAGGHLASSAAVHYTDPVLERWPAGQLRPDFQVLVYPVISFQDDIAHKGSRSNLMGEPIDPRWQQYFSNETQVTEATPPGFLVHAGDDGSVLVENSLRYYQALKAHGVSAGMLILPTGGHGFGMRNPIDWFATMTQWLHEEGF
ncbi:alpha/beta hydrolase [uncultured Gilvimarinus sp.]|uniref:alpha/beta hydrolase n=1 Tax=uncultured Gilvimarinus sp. TaxID=1689143 RepID=UPI0030EC7839|tara:strand:- start:3032 stop:4006 length:975 start_codon:yes stop_codon:yes gene_type:complete